jgi:hypothetical protein
VRGKRGGEGGEGREREREREGKGHKPISKSLSGSHDQPQSLLLLGPHGPPQDLLDGCPEAQVDWADKVGEATEEGGGRDCLHCQGYCTSDSYGS